MKIVCLITNNIISKSFVNRVAGLRASVGVNICSQTHVTAQFSTHNPPFTPHKSGLTSVLSSVIKSYRSRFCSKMAKLPNVVFVLGAPGAGKGTQCVKIVEEFGFVHLSAGDLLREERKRGGKVGLEIEKHIQNGTIVPVEVTCGLLEKAIYEHVDKNGKMDFLIDGFPRNKDNLDGWQRAMSTKANVKFVLFFEVSADIGVERALKRGQDGSGRSDDNIESLKKRINTYNDATMPIVDYYAAKGMVKTVDGAKTPDEVFSEVRKLFL